MRTFLVIPNGHEGGHDWEHIVRALTPLQACELLVKYFDIDDISSFKYAADVPHNPENTAAYWVTRELPDEYEGQAGVVNWKSIPAEFWIANYKTA